MTAGGQFMKSERLVLTGRAHDGAREQPSFEAAGGGYAMTRFDRAITTFGRGTVGYVWTFAFPPGRACAANLVPSRSTGRSAL